MASNSAVIIPPRTNSSAVALTNDIRPIQAPIEITDWQQIGIWSGGAALVLALAIAALLLWLKRRPDARNIVVPPHVRARERLNAALAFIHDPRRFCIGVSDAVRIYLEERFKLRAPERTTEEFLRDLQSTPHLDANQKETMVAFLERCDLVKFARFEPDEAALREMHEFAMRLVHETQFDPADVPGASSVPPPLNATRT